MGGGLAANAQCAMKEPISRRLRDSKVILYRSSGAHPPKSAYMAKQAKRSQQIEGVVKHLNFAKSGDPNGAVLDSGHFVHMKRRGARAIDLRVGQKLRVEGKSRGRGSAGHEVIEAERVNGVDLTSARATKKTASTKSAAKHAPAKKTALKKTGSKKTAATKTRGPAAG
jgi:hypothetical protein